MAMTTNNGIANVAPKKDKRVWRDVVVESGGRRLAGSYAVASGRIYVRYGERAKATQIGVSTPELLARLMIIEMAGATGEGTVR